MQCFCLALWQKGYTPLSFSHPVTSFNKQRLFLNSVEVHFFMNFVAFSLTLIRSHCRCICIFFRLWQINKKQKKKKNLLGSSLYYDVIKRSFLRNNLDPTQIKQTSSLCDVFVKLFTVSSYGSEYWQIHWGNWCVLPSTYPNRSGNWIFSLGAVLCPVQVMWRRRFAIIYRLALFLLRSLEPMSFILTLSGGWQHLGLFVLPGHILLSYQSPVSKLNHRLRPRLRIAL